MHAAPDADPSDIELSNVFFIVVGTNNRREEREKSFDGLRLSAFVVLHGGTTGEGMLIGWRHY